MTPAGPPWSSSAPMFPTKLAKVGTRNPGNENRELKRLWVSFSGSPSCRKLRRKREIRIGVNLSDAGQ
ncbi:hypothetical protein PHLCEN_2v11288 [Hermanssonia centrifuga]|uniref:Uncharacterized protein n=1 Tax=Hermanssonia centrifuga TaxID=98765 RepID=A0A2R6NKL9_9APHY|nr:hypothetical protein PHLCEN_2v11288 [Hermanssonia centrifuga]